MMDAAQSPEEPPLFGAKVGRLDPPKNAREINDDVSSEPVLNVGNRGNPQFLNLAAESTLSDICAGLFLLLDM